MKKPGILELTLLGALLILLAWDVVIAGQLFSGEPFVSNPWRRNHASVLFGPLIAWLGFYQLRNTGSIIGLNDVETDSRFTRFFGASLLLLGLVTFGLGVAVILYGEIQPL